MKLEIEAKFLNVDHDEIRQRLNELGGECEQPMRLMRRITIKTPYLREKNSFVRVRDEGHQVTMTYKQYDDLTVDGAKEIEIVVSSFEDAISLLNAAGLPTRSFQESRRETWKLDGCEVVLDEWPWLNPYIEIEGASEDEVREVAAKLGFDWNDAVFGDVMAAYRAQYPYLDENQTVGRIKEVRFGDPLPDLLKGNI